MKRYFVMCFLGICTCYVPPRPEFLKSNQVDPRHILPQIRIMTAMLTA